MQFEKNSCEQWKKEFILASNIKLAGITSDFAKQIIYKISPCRDEVVIETMQYAIENYRKNKSKT